MLPVALVDSSVPVLVPEFCRLPGRFRPAAQFIAKARPNFNSIALFSTRKAVSSFWHRGPDGELVLTPVDQLPPCHVIEKMRRLALDAKNL